jgi:hypothetical protein
MFYGIAKFAGSFLLYHHASDKARLLLFIAHRSKLANRFFGNHGHSCGDGVDCNSGSGASKSVHLVYRVDIYTNATNYGGVDADSQNIKVCNFAQRE